MILMYPKENNLLSELFHDNSKNKNYKWEGSRLPPSIWKKIYFKTYPRMDKIHLNNNTIEPKNSNIIDCIQKRRSYGDYKFYGLKKEELSYLLKNSVGFTKNSEFLDETRRAYPSGGGRYPCEIYVVVLKSKDISKGLYHYNVKEHNLERLISGNLIEEIKSFIISDNINLSSISALFIITSVFDRTQAKYGERGYRYILIESGHICQNFYLLSESLNLGSCEVGGFLDEEVIEFLDLEKNKEEPITMIVIGDPPDYQGKEVSKRRRIR